jgi:hypothetical protein
VVDQLMITVAMPRLQQYLLECAEFDAAAPWDVARSRGAVLLLLSMFQNCAFLPPALSSALPESLAQLVAELEAALREGAAAPDQAGYDAKRCGRLCDRRAPALTWGAGPQRDAGDAGCGGGAAAGQDVSHGAGGRHCTDSAHAEGPADGAIIAAVCEEDIFREKHI